MAVAVVVLSTAAAVAVAAGAAAAAPPPVAVELGGPVRVSGPSNTGYLWFPNALTLVPTGSGGSVAVLRVAVHEDANMAADIATLFTSVNGGSSWTAQTPGCTTETTSQCTIPMVCSASAPGCRAEQYGPTQSWNLAIPQPDGTLPALSAHSGRTRV